MPPKKQGNGHWRPKAPKNRQADEYKSGVFDDRVTMQFPPLQKSKKVWVAKGKMDNPEADLKYADLAEKKAELATPLSESKDNHEDYLDEQWATTEESRMRFINTVPVQTYLPVSTLNWAKTWHPDINAVNAEGLEIVKTSHPRAALERELAEMQIYERLRTRLGHHSMILDAGGNAVRHAAHKRADVISCCPILDPRDASREAKRKENKLENYCNCDLRTHMEAKCEKFSIPDGIMACDSLYYIPRDDWLSALARTTKGMGAATVHLHAKYYGVQFGGEYSYKRKGSEYIVNVKGELIPYRYEEPAWLRACAHSLLVDGVMHHFVWTIEQFGEFTYLVEFFPVDAPVEPLISEELLAIEKSLASEAHNGPVKWSLSSAKDDPNVDQVKIGELGDLKFQSSLTYLIASSNGMDVAIPKDLLASALLFVSMQQRTPAIFQALSRDIRSKLVSKYAVPVEDLAEVHRLTCLLGFYGNISHDAYFMTIAAEHCAEDVDQLTRAYSGAPMSLMSYIQYKIASLRRKATAASVKMLSANAPLLAGLTAVSVLGFVASRRNRQADDPLLSFRFRRVAPASLLDAGRSLVQRAASSRIGERIGEYADFVNNVASNVDLSLGGLRSRISREVGSMTDSLLSSYWDMLKTRMYTAFDMIRSLFNNWTIYRTAIPASSVPSATYAVMEGVAVGVAEESAHYVMGRPPFIRFMHILVEWYAAYKSGTDVLYWPAAAIHVCCHFLPIEYSCAIHSAYNALVIMTSAANKVGISPASLVKYYHWVAVVSVTILLWNFFRKGQPGPSPSRASLWSAWDNLRKKEADPNVNIAYGPKTLEAVEPSKPMPQEREIEVSTDEYKVVSVKQPFYGKSPSMQPSLKLMGIGSNVVHPIIFTKGTQSEYLAFRCRVAAERLPADSQLWLRARKFLLENAHLFLCGAPMPVSVVDFDTWASRFPPTRRDELKEAFCFGQDNDYKQPHLQKAAAFTKVEALLKMSPEGVEPTAPRMIQTFKARIVVITGPWVWSFAKAISGAAWSHGTRKTLSRVPRAYHASGASTERLGVVFEAMLNEASQSDEPYVINTDDATLFDMHCGVDAHETKLALYEHVGAPKDVISCLRMQSCPKLAGAAGNYVDVFDGMTSTGVTDTSTGGTIINSLVNHFAYSQSLEDINSNKDKSRPYRFRMVAMADDMVSCGPKADFTPVYYNVRRNMGIPYKPAQFAISDAFRAEFCQQRPWPTSAARIVWGPKPGRLIAKMPWSHLNLRVSTARRVLRGNALGFYATTRHVPFAREYVDAILRLTSSYEAVFTPSGEWVFRSQHKHAEMEGDAVIAGVEYPSTWNMIYSLYGLTPADLQDFVRALDAVDSVPCVLNHYVLEILNRVDNA